MNIFQKRKFASFFHVFALNCDILFIWKFSGLVHSSPWVIMKKLLQTINKYVNRFILRSQTVHFFKEIYFCKKKNPLLKSLKKTHENISRFLCFLESESTFFRKNNYMNRSILNDEFWNVQSILQFLCLWSILSTLRFYMDFHYP